MSVKRTLVEIVAVLAVATSGVSYQLPSTYVFTSSVDGSCQISPKPAFTFPSQAQTSADEIGNNHNVVAVSNASSGVGYRISSEYVLTVAHLFDAKHPNWPTEITSAAEGNMWERSEGTIVASNVSLDLALVRAAQYKNDGLVFPVKFRSQDVYPGERMVIKGLDPVSSHDRNRIRAQYPINLNVLAAQDHPDFYTSELVITAGLSGSPFIDSAGNIIGILEVSQTQFGDDSKDSGTLNVGSGYTNNAASLKEWTEKVTEVYPNATFYAGARPSREIVPFLEKFCNEKHDAQTGRALNQPRDAVVRFPLNSRNRRFYSERGYAQT